MEDKMGWWGGFRMIQAHYIYCALYFCYYINSTSDHQALDPVLDLLLSTCQIDTWLLASIGVYSDCANFFKTVPCRHELRLLYKGLLHSLSWLYSFLKCKFIIYIYYWCIIDLQCYINFRCTAKWIQLYIFQILSTYSLLQNIEYSSLCYTVSLCWLPIIFVVICKC